MKKSIKEKVIKRYELCDLDLIVQDELLGNNPDGHDYNYYCDESLDWREGDAAPIQLLLDTINDLKDAGATHIEISRNVDHHSYILTGIKLTVVEDNETKKSLAIKKLQRKIEEQEEIKKSMEDAILLKEMKLKELHEELNNIEENG